MKFNFSFESFFQNSNNAFSIWYESQKENLIKESPDLEEAELLKLAAKKFRLLKKSQETSANNSVNCFFTNYVFTIPKRRK